MAASSGQKGPNERLHTHLPSCTYRVGVAGDGCRYKSEVIEKDSTVVGDQRDKQEWKR